MPIDWDANVTGDYDASLLIDVENRTGVLAQVAVSDMLIAGIILYYFLATILPIDKIIGRIYPVFGAVLVFMATAIATAHLVAAMGA